MPTRRRHRKRTRKRWLKTYGRYATVKPRGGKGAKVALCSNTLSGSSTLSLLYIIPIDKPCNATYSVASPILHTSNPYTR